MAKKRYNAQAQAVCTTRDGYRTSIGLTTVFAIRATTKTRALRTAKRTWRSRGELPVTGMKKCVLHPSVEEAY